MKKIALMLILLILCSFAKSETVGELVKKTNIPSKKIKEYLNLDRNFPNNKELVSARITEEQIKKMPQQFKKDKINLIISITLSGMGVVFISLIIVAFIIAQLKHIGIIRKKILPRKQCRDLTSDGLVAAMLTIFLHEQEAEEANKVILTWKRAPVDMWKAVSKVETPNQDYYRRRNK